MWEKKPKPNREVNLHDKFNTCQLLFITDSKITSLLFCPNALFFCFGSFCLMSPEHWSLFLSHVSSEGKVYAVRLSVPSNF